MVHLPPDSRLLASLVKQEQAYSSQLYDLLNTSNASLSALVIYASSSPTEISIALKNIADALSGADDAFRNYGEAINNWIDQLRSINRKEEEVANVGRQRQILVTRLIKVSQKSKPNPQSLLHPASASDSASTVSFKSFNSKVSAAQMELQACESHLATQERELEAFRLNALKRGLQLRCQALVQCAWTWGELGRRCLSFLSDLNEPPSPNGASAPQLFHPLSPNGVYNHYRAPTLSSMAPSQSGSQVGIHFQDMQMNASSSHASPYSLNIPPPHRVSEDGAIPVPSPTKQSQQQGQEDEGSSSELDMPVEVHENPQYKRRSVLDKARGSIRKEGLPPSSSPQNSPHPRINTLNSDTNSLPSNSSQKDRKNHGIFGGLASLFKTSMSGKSSQHHGRKWDTRTDHNIRNVKTDVDNSSDEERSNLRKLSKRRSKSAVRHNQLGDSPALNGLGLTSSLAPTPASSPISTLPPQRPRDKRELLTRTLNHESSSARAGRERAVTLSPTGSPQPNGLPPDRLVFPTSSQRNSSLFDGHGRLPIPPLRDHSAYFSGEKEGGLSMIAENTASHDGPSTRRLSKNMSIPQAPPSVLSNRLNSGTTETRPSVDGTSFLVRAPTSATHRSEKKPLKSALRNTSKERDGSTSPLPASVSSSSSPPRPPPAVLSAPIPIHVMRPPPSARPLTPISPTPSDPTPSDPIALQTALNTVSPESGISLLHLPSERPSSPRPSVAETSSISSYETGREDFYDYDEEHEDGGTEEQDRNDHHMDLSTLPVLLLQPHPDQASVQELQSQVSSPPIHADVHEVSSVTSGDTTIANGSEVVARRRKSVRMSSLPPEVLERTPTQEDYEDGGPFAARKSPRSRPSFSDTATTATVIASSKAGSGWKSRADDENPANVWQDSSEEDEGYKAARRALTRAKRRSSLVRK